MGKAGFEGFISYPNTRITLEAGIRLITKPVKWLIVQPFKNHGFQILVSPLTSLVQEGKCFRRLRVYPDLTHCVCRAKLKPLQQMKMMMLQKSR